MTEFIAPFMIILQGAPMIIK